MSSNGPFMFVGFESSEGIEFRIRVHFHWRIDSWIFEHDDTFVFHDFPVGAVLCVGYSPVNGFDGFFAIYHTTRWSYKHFGYFLEQEWNKMMINFFLELKQILM